ncbi:hypothetical protein Y032_0107g3788 [Ancylostoma ceylanicum]|uniref:Uncharacterized protein n=1 Tax=Ancylostoma ceylanicum TaxID=53326 RepID=A0A016TFM5_9BILA|nr:hypothetical protein Y032_0107g3788 [Ancylostoma ceylanicum]
MKKGRGRATLIGTFGPHVTPTCLDSSGVDHVIYGLFVLSAVRVEAGGRGGRPKCANQSRWLRPFSVDDTHQRVHSRNQCWQHDEAAATEGSLAFVIASIGLEYKLILEF